MTQNLSENSTPKITSIAPEDMQVIFDNIEDNLAFWRVLYNDDAHSKDDRQPVSLESANEASDWLKMSSAPLYPSFEAGGVRGMVYRVLNLVIKLFGNPQIRFNRKQREFLGNLMPALGELNSEIAALNTTVDDLRKKLQALGMENEELQQEIAALTRRVESQEINVTPQPDAHDSKPRAT